MATSEFYGKKALVTGGAQGIGRAISLELLKLGAQVTVFDVSEAHLLQLKAEHPSIKTFTVNLCDWSKVEATFKLCGDIDLLVNSAGVALINPIQEVTEDIYDRSFSVNVKGLFKVTQEVVAGLKRRQVPGAIVNLSSQASQAGLLNHTVYCATKGAVDGFTRAAALEFGPNSIRVNSVNPTVVMTDLGRLAWSKPLSRAAMLEKIPLGRFAEVPDVVAVVIFLLSNAASMVNGVCLPVDGGFLAC